MLTLRTKKRLLTIFLYENFLRVDCKAITPFALIIANMYADNK